MTGPCAVGRGVYITDEPACERDAETVVPLTFVPDSTVSVLHASFAVCREHADFLAASLPDIGEREGPVIESVTITNWQSLRKLDLPLGRFTVITGASSSGKSAFIRAMRGIASNVRGTSALTRGKTTAAITVRSNGQKVTLQHTGGAWRYRLVGLDGTEREYAKLNAQVPADVTEALRINPVPTSGISVNFASQFDPPYLLGDAGSSVARVLGELTNVDRVFAAVREANRRRTAAVGALKTRQSDLEAVRGQLIQHRGLQGRLEAAQRAQEGLNRLTQLDVRVRMLSKLIETITELGQYLSRPEPVVPDRARLASAEQHAADFVALARAVRDYEDAERALLRAERDLAAADLEHQTAEQELHQLLDETGTCPTCGQPVTNARIGR